MYVYLYLKLLNYSTAKVTGHLRVKLGFDTTLTTTMSNSLVTQIEQSAWQRLVCTVRHPCNIR